MEFGLVLTQFSDRWDHVLSDATSADELGIDSVWLADHLVGLRDVEGSVFEAWTALSFIAAKTSRVRLGHVVNAVSFRNVGLLAKMVATLDVASGGRLVVGLGAGWYRREYEAFGYEFPTPGDRRRFFEEYLGVLIRLLQGEVLDHEGRFLTLHQAVCRPRPLQTPHPPILVGTSGDKMMEITARRADLWNCPAGSLPRLDDLVARMRRLSDGREVGVTVQIPVAVGRDRTEAAAAREVGRAHMSWMGDIDRIGITGTVADAAQQVAALAARGVGGLIATLPGSRQRPEFIEAYAELAAAVRG